MSDCDTPLFKAINFNENILLSSRRNKMVFALDTRVQPPASQEQMQQSTMSSDARVIPAANSLSPDHFLCPLLRWDLNSSGLST